MQRIKAVTQAEGNVGWRQKGDGGHAESFHHVCQFTRRIGSLP